METRPYGNQALIVFPGKVNASLLFFYEIKQYLSGEKSSIKVGFIIQLRSFVFLSHFDRLFLIDGQVLARVRFQFQL